MPSSIPQPNLVLAGDIGGTKVNLGVFRTGKTKPVPVGSPRTFSSSSAPDLETHIDRFLNRFSLGSKIKSACFGIAGPVIRGRVKTTNLPWVVSEARLRKRFGLLKVCLINDLVATALSIPVLNPKKLQPLNRAQADRHSHVAVVAPGTGLGKALVAGNGNQVIPVASEGGHAGFAPSNQAQMRLWRHLKQRFGRASQERVLSGNGLVNIYRWLRDGEDMRPSKVVENAFKGDESKVAATITARALAHRDPICKKSLKSFVEIFGAIVGDWALSTMARGGVYLGGGIPPKILPALQTETFINAYHAKGQFSDVVAAIPVKVILDDRAALLGAARYAFMA